MPRTEVFNRDHVMEAARDAFWTKGYNGTSMQDLVDATGLNRSSIYNSFGNKMALYKAVLIQYQEESQSIFQEALHRAGNPLEAIQFIFENYINEILKDENEKGCFSLNCKAEMTRSNSGIKEYLEKMQDQEISFFQDLVQEGQDFGLINKEELAFHYAYFLANALQGLRMTGMLMRKPEVLEHIVANTLKTLV